MKMTESRPATPGSSVTKKGTGIDYIGREGSCIGDGSSEEKGAMLGSHFNGWERSTQEEKKQKRKSGGKNAGRDLKAQTLQLDPTKAATYRLGGGGGGFGEPTAR